MQRAHLSVDSIFSLHLHNTETVSENPSHAESKVRTDIKILSNDMNNSQRILETFAEGEVCLQVVAMSQLRRPSQQNTTTQIHVARELYDFHVHAFHKADDERYHVSSVCAAIS